METEYLVGSAAARNAIPAYFQPLTRGLANPADIGRNEGRRGGAALKTRITRNGDEIILALGGHLAFADRAAFVEIIPGLPTDGARRLVVDLSDLHLIDSAGLGMLLMLRESATKAGVETVLCRPQPGVSKLLEMAAFASLFTIEHA